MLKDFGDRCAYSLMHVDEAYVLEVDHFNPRLKSKHQQSYTNLMPAFGECNRTKGMTWPSHADLASGLRFLDPTKEIDYGVHIFEEPDTHQLKGVTPAGRYHIRVLGLNSKYLVERRRLRSHFRRLVSSPEIFLPGWVDPISGKNCQESLQAFISHVAKLIPDIPPPPT